jgi:hypothetical protein
MPRLSLWKDGKHSNDYKFFDRRISEMFTIGGTGILLHKYLGPNSGGLQLTTTAAQVSAGTVLTFATTSSVNIGDSVSGAAVTAGTTVVAKDASTVTLSAATTSAVGLDVAIGFSSDATKPAYINQSAQNIQDLLFLENRDRKYDTSVYKMRGHYQVADQDFDLSQFGLFLATGTLFMTFHLNDMIDTLGRRIMNGDVLELQHLIDYDPLNQNIPAALKRFFVVSDCSRASEGYSPTWWPHLWRVKLNPMVDSQEYKDIINSLTATDPLTGNVTPIGQLISTLDTNLAINDAIIKQAEADVPRSGYDTSPIYIKPLTPNGEIVDTPVQPTPDKKVQGYLTSDGLAPNGFPVHAGITFPDSPVLGDFALRTDYLPNRLFRFDGARWVRIEDVKRTGLTPGPTDQTLLGTFMNQIDSHGNAITYTDSVGNVHKQQQSLSKALTPKADN